MVTHGMASDGGVLDSGPLRTVCLDENGLACARR